MLGDTQPWRRGRFFLVVVACLSLLGQGLLVASAIIAGVIEFAVLQAIVAAVYWLQFYFIWIGVHWVRWLNGAFSALCGFTLVIWGFRDGNTLGVIFGLFSFAVGCYMAVAPSVYFFAKRQKETVRLFESIAIAFGFLVLLGTLLAGFFGLLGYRANIEREARHFAHRAFHRIFDEHDTEFLLAHASERLEQSGGDRAALTAFMQDTAIRVGHVYNIAEPTGSLRFWYSFPFHISSEGPMTTAGQGNRHRIRMYLLVGDESGDWQIHAIRWDPEFVSGPGEH